MEPGGTGWSDRSVAMRWQNWIGVVAACALGLASVGPARGAEALTQPSKLTLNEAGALLVDGKPVFPITLTVVPGPDARGPNVAGIIHENDANHPIWLGQAPRGTGASMKRYNNGWDVGGIDIYPVSYPPGVHSEEKNKELSMVGDWTRTMREVAGRKPFWMTLQIAFSGVAKPGRTLRFLTFPEQRFMAYEAIINGSRGLTYFGGGIPQTLNVRDQALGFNWTYWDRVMKPLLEEIGPKSP